MATSTIQSFVKTTAITYSNGMPGYITKSGNIVTAVIPTFTSRTLAAWGDETIGTIPEGFRPSQAVRFPLIIQNISKTLPVYIFCKADGSIMIQNQSGDSQTTGAILQTAVTWVSV